VQTWRNCSVLIPPGEERDLGFLFFQAPANVTSGYYTIMVEAEVQNAVNGTEWKDIGPYGTTGYRYADLKTPLSFQSFTTTKNTATYYSKVNTRINLEATAGLASNILANNSNVYSIQAVADAFDWVRDHIAYADDPQDYWQSSTETMAWRTGDCEDQAILMASIIDQMGGNARVNIIDGHAFSTVFVGGNGTSLSDLREAISSHYHTQVPIYFLSDSTGNWMWWTPPASRTRAGWRPSPVRSSTTHRINGRSNPHRGCGSGRHGSTEEPVYSRSRPGCLGVFRCQDLLHRFRDGLS